MDLFRIIQILVAVALVIVILLQNRGSAMSGVFGGGGSNVYMAKRGLDKSLFVATIVLSIMFFLVSIIIILF